MGTHMKKKKGNRGSALMIVAYLGSIMALVLGIHFYRSSQKASLESQVRENAAAAHAVAELAAESAASSLRDVEYVKINDDGDLGVLRDWVARNPYDASSAGMNSVERRLTGTINGYQYRTIVRAVREAKELTGANAPPQGWLTAVEPKDYDFGVDPLWDFTGSYEIISSARKEPGYNHDGKIQDPTFTFDSGLRTVINLNYNSIVPKVDLTAVLHADSGANVGEISTGAIIGGGGGGPGDTETLNGMENIFVSGEDHYAVKAATKNITRETVIEGLAAIPDIPSQLYSVVNDKWDLGRMSMHFRNGDEVNPNIPRTVDFSTAAINRLMVELDTGRLKDEYVFGGKRYASVYYSQPTGNGSNLIYGYGRSVSLLEDGTIREITGAQATPSMYAESALAVGSPENILKFYLNFTLAHPAATASAAAVNAWKNNWTQLPLGYHTKNKTKNGALRNYRRPLDNKNSTARRRWTVLMWIKDESGRFLVRDYTSWGTASDSTDSMRSSYPVPTSTWNGRYQWAMYGGYGSSTNSDGGHYHIGNFSPTNTHASTKQTLHTRILTLEEAIGYEFFKDSDGIPCKVSGFAADTPPTSKTMTQVVPDSRVIAGVPDYYYEEDANGKKAKVEYRVNKGTASETQFNEAYQRQNRSDNYGLPGSFSYPTDGLYVYDPVTRQTTKYTTLREFAFKKDISTVAGKEDIREMVLLHMVFEDNPEVTSTSPNMYFDMGFTVTLVYPKKIAAVDDDDFLKEVFQHWWEGDAEETLTGELSHKAISTVIDNNIIVGLTEDVEKVKAYYEQFGFFDPSGNAPSEVPSVNTMVDGSRGLRGIFRPIYSEEYGQETEIIGVDGNAEPGSPVFFGYDDIARVWFYKQELFLSALFEAYYVITYGQPAFDVLLLNADDYNSALTLWRIDEAVRELRKDNPQYTLKELPERWNEENRVESHLTLEDMDAFMAVFDPITARSFTADAFGFKYNEVPGRYSKYDDDGEIKQASYSDITGSGDNTIPADDVNIIKTIYFMPGEIVPYIETQYNGKMVLRSAGDFGGATHQPMMYKDNVLNPNTDRPIEPKFIFHEDDTLEADEKSIVSIHDYPEWFTGVHPTDFDGYENGDLVPPLVDKYPREHRGLIGWHREGPIATIPDTLDGVTEQDYQLMYGDSWEYVIMTKKGFNPYEVVNPGITTEQVALLRPEGTDPVALKDCTPKFVPPEKMPTFVIEGKVFSNGEMKGKALDGAGILVVNGNLEIRNTFAYHGILVVMGDIYVVPEEYYAVDNDNVVVDGDGNKLSKDGSGWYYMDENGARQTSYPLRDWCGELIVQGKVYVGGKIYTAKAKQLSAGDTDIRPAGKIDIRGSEQAVKEVVKMWAKAAPNEGFVTERLGWSSNVSIDNYELWKD